MNRSVLPRGDTSQAWCNRDPEREGCLDVLFLPVHSALEFDVTIGLMAPPEVTAQPLMVTATPCSRHLTSAHPDKTLWLMKLQIKELSCELQASIGSLLLAENCGCRSTELLFPALCYYFHIWVLVTASVALPSLHRWKWGGPRGGMLISLSIQLLTLNCAEPCSSKAWLSIRQTALIQLSQRWPCSCHCGSL